MNWLWWAFGILGAAAALVVIGNLLADAHEKREAHTGMNEMVYRSGDSITRKDDKWRR